MKATACDALRHLGDTLGLELTDALIDLLTEPAPPALRARAYRAVDGMSDRSLLWAITTMRFFSTQPVDGDLLPIAGLDDQSYACVVCRAAGHAAPADEGSVVRWHLGEVPPRAQRQLIDTRPDAFMETLLVEETTRPAGLALIQDLADGYHTSHDEGRRLPRAHECRPIRIACQNVILGLAAFRYDAGCNGLSVRAWQTCEAPHVAVHEGNRALAALTIAEAFRTGGTMEIRFDEHLEGRIPARLRQFGRVQGLSLGADDPQAISPREARTLIQAVTPMPEELATRVRAAADGGVQTVERACYLLLAGVWKPIELDYLLATSTHAEAILTARTDVLERAARQVETALCRAAAMVGTLHARLSLPVATADHAEAIEDDRQNVPWSVLGTTGAVVLHPQRDGPLPWQSRTAVALEAGRPLLLLPRAVLSRADVELALDLATAQRAVAATLEAPDMVLDDPTPDVARLVYPDRLQALDAQIERRLVASRVGRA